MPNPIPVTTPATYAPISAIGFAEADSNLSPVSATNPLPVALAVATAPPVLAGTATGTAIVGPFAPIAGKPVMLVLSGQWSGSARVLRSTDGGATKLPLTAAGLAWGGFTGNCCEPVWEESVTGASLYLDIALTSGTLTYRVAQ